MHPAYSVIVFTTASGAGYGLLAWLGLARALGLVSLTPTLALVGIGLALALITIGLLSSTLHLGRPERAWRALSQWRSSWLSREGVLAVLTYVPALALALGGLRGAGDIEMRLAGIASAVLAGATVWATGMIYAALPTIPAWHRPIVAPVYVVLALATGGVLLNVILALLGPFPAWSVAAALGALLAGWVMKALYWREIDTLPPTASVATATGLGRFGTVRPLDAPHTQPNFVMREMGFVVARRHAARLREIVVLALFVVPAAILALLPLAGGPLRVVFALAAVASVAVGVLVERWLFFAEARHVVMTYYGVERV